VIVFIRLAGGASRLAGRAAAGLGRAGLRGAQALGLTIVQRVGRQLNDAGSGGLEIDAGGLFGGGGAGGDRLPAVRAAVRVAAGRAAEVAANEMAAEAQRLAPVKTGRLRESIQVRKLSETAWEVSVEAPYAAFVEYGTSRAAPRPCFRPAFEKVAARYTDLAGKELNAAIDRACR